MGPLCSRVNSSLNGIGQMSSWPEWAQRPIEGKAFGQPTDDLSISGGRRRGFVLWGKGRGGDGDYLEYAKPEFGINPVFDKLLFLHSFSLWLFWNISLSRFKSCNESNLDVAFIPPPQKKEAHDWTAANIFKSELFCPRGDGVMDRALWLSGLCSSPVKSKCFFFSSQTQGSGKNNALEADR